LSWEIAGRHHVHRNGARAVELGESLGQFPGGLTALSQ
jgi:hypothetical protein